MSADLVAYLPLLLTGFSSMGISFVFKDYIADPACHDGHQEDQGHQDRQQDQDQRRRGGNQRGHHGDRRVEDYGHGSGRWRFRGHKKRGYRLLD